MVVLMADVTADTMAVQMVERKADYWAAPKAAWMVVQMVNSLVDL